MESYILAVKKKAKINERKKEGKKKKELLIQSDTKKKGTFEKPNKN